MKPPVMNPPVMNPSVINPTVMNPTVINPTVMKPPVMNTPRDDEHPPAMAAARPGLVVLHAHPAATKPELCERSLLVPRCPGLPRRRSRAGRALWQGRQREPVAELVESSVSVPCSKTGGVSSHPTVAAVEMK